MANSQHTTNPAAGRVWGLVFDMDDNLTRLQANLTVLEELTKGYKLMGATENQQAVHWTIGKVVDTTDELRKRYDKLFHAASRRGHDNPEPPKSIKPVERTISDLCHQWDIVQAKLSLGLLQTGGDDVDEQSDRLMAAAHAQFKAVERAILDTDPNTIRDVDLVVMLRLARKVIGNDDFTDEQEGRCHEMLDLIETTLVRRVAPGDWSRAAA